MTQQITIDEIHRVIGALFLETRLQAERIAALEASLARFQKPPLGAEGDRLAREGKEIIDASTTKKPSEEG